MGEQVTAAKKKKSNAGRPSVMTEATIRKLEEAFMMGCTDREACLFANIAQSSLYLYIESHPEFSERKDRLKDNPILLARGVVVNHLKKDDINTAHKVLDRKEGSKVAVSGPEGGAIQVTAMVRRIIEP